MKPQRRSYGTKQIATDGKAARQRAALYLARAREKPTAEMLAQSCKLSLATAAEMLEAARRGIGCESTSEELGQKPQFSATNDYESPQEELGL